jgi:hypothetical protein
MEPVPAITRARPAGASRASAVNHLFSAVSMRMP